IAEFVLARVLSLFQREQERHLLQAAREWRPLPFREIHGTRWLIIGFGAIGRDVAIRARAFGAQIVGMRRDTTPDPDADYMAHPDQLHAELASADVVVLAVPLSEATRSLIDHAALAAMKPDAVLVNVGRGGLIDQDALCAALGAGSLGHAILDVAVPEPLPAESRLWADPHIWITAHGSAYGDGLGARADRFALGNIRRFLAGESPHNLVSA
ncbi:MAG: NAD(P)-dependent oxidoreductase, partial [Rhizorhabdus sp.]